MGQKFSAPPRECIHPLETLSDSPECVHPLETVSDSPDYTNILPSDKCGAVEICPLALVENRPGSLEIDVAVVPPRRHGSCLRAERDDRLLVQLAAHDHDLPTRGSTRWDTSGCASQPSQATGFALRGASCSQAGSRLRASCTRRPR